MNVNEFLFSGGAGGIFTDIIYRSLGIADSVLATNSPIDMHVGYNTRRVHCATRLSANTNAGADAECRVDTTKEREEGERNRGRGNMLELIQLSAACRGSQYRDIVPVCGGSAERVADTSRRGKERGGGEVRVAKRGMEVKEELISLPRVFRNK